MLYTADQARQKLMGKELDSVTVDLENVEKALNEAFVIKRTTYGVVKYHICEEAVSKLKELGYNVSLNVSNRCTYVSLPLKKSKI